MEKKFTIVRLAIIAALCAFGASVEAASDTWITTKAKIALMTSAGVPGTKVNVDTVDGTVTIHGKVKTPAEKSKAETVVKEIDGVKDVRNLLQVVPEADKEMVKASDEVIKDKVQAALKVEKGLDGGNVKVASVNDGVVLLSGKADTMGQKLKAIEVAWNVGGVKRVASEIESTEK